MNLHIQICVNILLYILVVIHLEVEMLTWLTLSLTFWRIVKFFSKAATPFYIPTSNV